MQCLKTLDKVQARSDEKLNKVVAERMKSKHVSRH